MKLQNVRIDAQNYSTIAAKKILSVTGPYLKNVMEA